MARVCSCSLAGIEGSNPAGGMDDFCECCVFSIIGLCNEPLPRPDESYRLSCVIVCDLETSRIWRPWPALGCCARGKL